MTEHERHYKVVITSLNFLKAQSFQVESVSVRKYIGCNVCIDGKFV